MDIFNKLNLILKKHYVQVYFCKEASLDLNRYNKDTQEKILALIIKRAIGGPLIKPNGLGDPLGKELNGFTKIKPKKLGLRIIYRPKVVNELIHMEIIAIGPRDRQKVYHMAAGRLEFF